MLPMPPALTAPHLSLLRLPSPSLPQTTALTPFPPASRVYLTLPSSPPVRSTSPPALQSSVLSPQSSGLSPHSSTSSGVSTCSPVPARASLLQASTPPT